MIILKAITCKQEDKAVYFELDTLTNQYKEITQDEYLYVFRSPLLKPYCKAGVLEETATTETKVYTFVER